MLHIINLVSFLMASVAQD